MSTESAEPSTFSVRITPSVPVTNTSELAAVTFLNVTSLAPEAAAATNFVIPEIKSAS